MAERTDAPRLTNGSVGVYVRWCVVLGNTLLLLAAVEGAAIVYAMTRGRSDPPRTYCDSLALDPADAAWCPQYAADYARYDWAQRYRSYTMFGSKPWTSATINIDGRGLRTTPNGDATPDAVTVAMFGGSTMVGVGVPDDRTVPSYVLRGLKRRFPDRAVRVVNYGSGWWVSSQSLVRLLLELRDGVRPDVVVFYDGINDLDAVTQDAGAAPQAGEIWPDLRQAFMRTADPPPPHRFVPALLGVLSSLRSVTLMRSFLSEGASLGRSPQPSVDTHAIQVASAAVAEVYRNNLEALRALSRQYGFEMYAFWQPSPLVRAALAPCSPTLLDERRRQFPHEPAIYRDVYASVAQTCGDGKTCVYLGGLFDRPQPRCPYTDDEGHLGPRGNEEVAEAMLAHIGALPGVTDRSARK